jgi:hypothetical protein
MDFSPSANLDHGGKDGILKGIQLRFRQKRAFWNAQDHPHLVSKAALGPQVVLTVRKTTSWAVSTGVANLDATQEVKKT